MRRRCAGAVLGLLGMAGCADLLQYTDELNDGTTGRSLLVTVPATTGGLVGFVAGIPVDVVLLPFTYAICAWQDARGVPADPISTMLFPSFFLQRTGKLVAVPFDLLEYVVYRAWRPRETYTRQERERIEAFHDAQSLPSYPVAPIYPRDGEPVWREDAEASAPFGIRWTEPKKADRSR